MAIFSYYRNVIISIFYYIKCQNILKYGTIITGRAQSPIAKIFKVGKEYIIMTENSIYIVDVEIPTKRITS